MSIRYYIDGEPIEETVDKIGISYTGVGHKVEGEKNAKCRPDARMKEVIENPDKISNPCGSCFPDKEWRKE